MAFAGKELADGQLPSTKAAIYICPASTVAYIKSITLFNTNASDQTILLYINPAGGSSRTWKRYVLAQNEHADVIGAATSIILEAGGAIEAETTDGSAVDYTISGVEET